MKRRSVLRSKPHFSVMAFAFALVAALALPAGDAWAKAKKSKPAANEKYAAIVVDAKTGKVLHASSADAYRYPASLTKMMTLYVLFEELESGRMSLDTKLRVSKVAQAQAPSKIGLKAGSTIRVEDAIKALTVKSANDAAVVIAENISGSVSAFGKRMTRTARAIGMSKSTFVNPNGLPDPRQKTSARDMATLGRALQDRFPRYYKYFSTTSFAYGKARYRNHNRLIGRVEGVDGIKTGYIRASGFNLVTNIRRDGRHLVAVVMGGKTGASRDAQMRKLLAEYLPDATKGKRTAPLLVANAELESTAGEASAANSAEDDEADATETKLLALAPAAPAAPAVPAPKGSRLQASPDIIAARISAANEVAELAYAPEFGSGEDPIARLAELAQSRTGVAPAPKLAQSDLTARPASQADDLVASGQGWVIQIGAVPTEEAAEALLKKARRSMGAALGSADPMTQAVEKNGATLYRARFAGFTGKDHARETCAKLKSKAISCLAIPN